MKRIIVLIEDGNQEATEHMEETFMNVLNTDILHVSNYVEDYEKAYQRILCSRRW